MLIAYAQPTPIVFSLVGTGATFASDDSGLNDGIPARETEITWLSADPTALTDYLTLRANWETPTPVRVVAVLGLRYVPAGVKLELRGEFEGAAGVYGVLGGNALTQETVEFPDGSIGAVWVLPTTNANLTGLELRFYNDEGGLVWADDESTFRIGELFIGQAVDVPISPDPVWEPMDPSQVHRTISSQLSTVRRPAYYRLRVSFAPATLPSVRGESLANDMDWQKLEHALMGSTRCMVIARYERAGSLDTAEMHRTAHYGIGMPGATSHIARDIYSASYQFESIPCAS